MEDKREFIRLSELEKITPVSREQVMDAIEYDRFCLNALVNLQGAGGVSSDNTLLAIFDFRGIVKLTNKQSLSLINDGSLKLTTLEVVKFLSCSKHRLVSDVFPKCAEGCFNRIATSLDELEGLEYIVSRVVLGIPEQSSLKHSFEKEMGCRLDEKPNEVGFAAALKIFDSGISAFSKSTRNLMLQPISLKTESIRLSRQALYQHFDLGNHLDSVTVTEANQVNTGAVGSYQSPDSMRLANRNDNLNLTEFNQSVETHPIKEIQKRVLEKYPDAQSREVWNRIRQDIRTEVYEFDIDMVVDEISDERLIYKSSGEEGLSYRRFQNILSEVRKNMHG
ncbi:hypothetical protein LYZ37_10985 [Vibrio tubiashii]|uniref:hypothetical protein n=1 Tax=Vibrio tubiashii TaxID=29498 RepID=UPI00234EBBE8|nr:hypothetical protein [Vibrio tubiashii]WCP66384.1 hypothetical protein LYZ37_10985 [Vibrio tubiashii]